MAENKVADNKIAEVPTGFGDIRSRSVEAIDFAKEVGENVKLTLNDTSIIVAPGSNPEEVVANWTQIRRLQEELNTLKS